MWNPHSGPLRPRGKKSGVFIQPPHQSLMRAAFGVGCVLTFQHPGQPWGQRSQEGCPAKSRLRPHGGALVHPSGQLAGGHYWGQERYVLLASGTQCIECLLCARHSMLDSTGHWVYGMHVARWRFPPLLTPAPCIPPGCCPSRNTCCTFWGWRRPPSACMPCL